MVKGTNNCNTIQCSILKHSRRLSRVAYAVWLLNEINEHHSKDIKISLMYDIACILVRHLKVHVFILFKDH